HSYLVRSVEPVTPPLMVPHAVYITARGPFAETDERTMLEQHRIDIVVAKNSGGPATYGKIAAARALALPVIMLRRPSPPPYPPAQAGGGIKRIPPPVGGGGRGGAAVETGDGGGAWLGHVSAPATPRGV